MTQVLKNLVSLLSLEAIEEDLYRGSSQDLGFRQLFGGQVLGQCVSAASRTVEASRHVHSMHGYFLRPGDASLPVVFFIKFSIGNIGLFRLFIFQYIFFGRIIRLEQNLFFSLMPQIQP